MKTLTCAFVLALLPTLAGAIERPDWAFPPAGVTGAPRPPETGDRSSSGCDGPDPPGSTQAMCWPFLPGAPR